MLFDTPVYLVFLSLLCALYWCLAFRPQNFFLLAASYFFYGWWDWRFLSLIFASTVVDYFCALTIERSSEQRIRKLCLVASLVLNFSFLGFFKYFNFFASTFREALSGVGIEVHPFVLDILLPPGISFYTFQAVAYIVDVYRRQLTATKSFVDYALFISLFPHLIAGPIQRPNHLLPQVSHPRLWNSEQFYSGLLLILTGLFRKCVIADNCALVANGAFSGQLGDSWVAALAGAYAFAWQIYGDFSGYSDIARGSAQLLGFHFMVNFRQPYLATSFQDFWRRWHISLSTWLRDYLYIPLGGNRGSSLSIYRNLFLTMLIGGFWHGANWTFVAWGALHGGYLAAERRWGVSEPRSFAGLWLRRTAVFHGVLLAWIFFRAESISKAWYLLHWRTSAPTLVDYYALAYVAVFALAMFGLDLLLENSGEEYPLAERPPSWRLTAGVTLAALTLLFAGNQLNAFIYFQF